MAEESQAPSQTDYTFHPRPEAHPMKWGELMSPLRRAVRDLLLLLEGAVEQIDRSNRSPGRGKTEQITANCFLVSGERGTGKTTVLLSAKEAVCEDTDRFFSVETGADLPERPKESKFREEALQSAKRLKDKRTVWLEVIDLESLPPHANMLTTMLTRVLHALNAGGAGINTLESSSILEEEADRAQYQLVRLIKDATLMWEDIREQNTRDRANRQIAAADIYTHFRERFEKAIETISKELAPSYGRKEERVPIILPIDNIDRSTDHLYNIIKLAQMIASPYLWVVLAGDREDVETFLERAYWKELISIGEGAGGVGKVGMGKEDEALVMARRQAAAASHKLLPPSHRIELELVRPEETLDFRRSSKARKISNLFDKIVIPNARKASPFTLLDMLVAGRHKGAVGTEAPTWELTHAATLALQLPARGVLDLWQQAERMCNDATRFTGVGAEDDFRAEKIARTMLLNSITESKITSEMGLYLRDNIIHREPNGTTTLKFCKPNPILKVTRSRVGLFQRRLRPALEPPNLETWRYAVRSGIAAVGREEVLICSLSRDESGKDELELPPVVAGWLLVLHDVVAEAGRSWVLKSNLDVEEVHFVVAQHETVCSEGQRLVKKNKERWWPAPHWETYLAHDVLWLRWERFLLDFKAKEGLALRPDDLAWVLAVAWMGCVLDTFFALTGRDRKFRDQDEALEERRLVSTLAVLKAVSTTDEGGYHKCVLECETRVLTAAALLYADIMQVARSTDEQLFFQENGLSVMRDWLEQKMPLLLSHLYVPLYPKAADKRQANLETLFFQEPQRKEDRSKEHKEEPEKDDKDSEREEREEREQKARAALGKAWVDNFPFVYAGYHADLAEIFPGWDKTTDGEPKRQRPDTLGGFGKVYRLFNREHTLEL